MLTRKRLLLTATVVVAALAAAAVATTAVNATIRQGHPDAEEHESVVNNSFASTGSCGVERWSVKTGTDADNAKITLQSTTQSTIAALTALPAPGSLPANNRVAPTEDTVYQLHATLTQYKLEADSDYHMVLSDGSGHTMIAEIADPACVGSTSPLLTSIQKSRGEFDARYTPTTSFQTANVPVTVTGVGFFDFQHGQTGVAPNGIELHSVLDVQFTTGGGGNTVTVTNPGAQTGTVGVATSLQIQARDSTSGQLLSYTATGLPAGLAISSAGLISGSPTAAGTSSVTVTATDTSGASGGTTFTWRINPAAGGGCTGGGQLLVNPGFETGTAPPWTATSGVISNSSSQPAHGGTWKAWLDGYGSAHTDTLAQTVALPVGCATYSFSFWLHVDTAETSTTTKYDTLTVQILNSSGVVLATLATYSNLDHNTGYLQHTFNLAAYASQSVTVKVTGTEDYTAQTTFVIDDTALTAS